MATLSGLNVLALTDHNSVKNCPAFFKAAKGYDVIPIAGMELTTSEDIHVVFLFDSLDDALRFGQAIEEKRLLIRNKPEIFGEQLIFDESDEIVAREEYLLSMATSISVEEVLPLADEYNAVVFPAHIDRPSNSITAILGTIPEHLRFSAVELCNVENTEKYRDCIRSARVVISSDTHDLSMMRDASSYLEVDTDGCDDDEIRRRFLDLLR